MDVSSHRTAAHTNGGNGFAQPFTASKPYNIVVASLPFWGHLLPAVRAAGDLVKRGHSVTVLTSRATATRLEALPEAKGFELAFLDDFKTQADADAFGTKVSSLMPICYAHASPWVREAHARKPIDYAIVDFMSAGYGKAFREMGIRYMINLPGPESCLQFSHGMKFAAPPGMSVLGLLWSMMWKGNLGFVSHIMALRTQIRAVCLGRPCLLHTVPSMFWAPSNVLPPNVRAVGAVCPKLNAGLEGGSIEPLPAELEQFITGSPKPVVLMTLGSTPNALDPQQVTKVITGLRDDRWKAIAVVHQSVREKLPEEIKSSKDILFVGWIPQAQLMARPEVAAVITHCGWGATLETVKAGKPTVCLPSFGDQHGNARIMESKGMAIRLDIGTFTVKELNTAVSDILMKPSFREAAEKVGGLLSVATFWHPPASCTAVSCCHDGLLVNCFMVNF
mmetsp:Transcript_539/g.1633  ORF Transcript_539/g.1633 Transcript_539/m.1633 type:complete len:449 (+) Transcript_539:310-1656(+)